MIKQNPVVSTEELKEFEDLIKQHSIGFKIDSNRYEYLLSKIILNEKIRDTTAKLVGYKNYSDYLAKNN